MECRSERCFLWISASTGNAPRSKYTAAVAVLSGRDCIILKFFCDFFLKLQYGFC